MRYLKWCLIVMGVSMLGFSPQEPPSQRPDVRAQKPAVLRVCADPNDLPFSNRNREGYENKIAEVIARAMGARLEFFWWPYQRGLVRRTLNAGRCDVLISVPTNYERVLTTKPYYRSTYVFVYRKDRGLHIRSFKDPILKKLRVGVHMRTPPHDLLILNGVPHTQLRVYMLFYDPNFHPEDYPGRLVEDVIRGNIDVGVVWGPIAGYFVAKKGAPLEIVPVDQTHPRIPVAFNMSMGVRKKNYALKAQLERIIDTHRDEILAILREYGVPLVPIVEPRGDMHETDMHARNGS